MDQISTTRWGNHDITSDGRIVEECISTSASGRRVVWYDELGRVARREGVSGSGSRRPRDLTA